MDFDLLIRSGTMIEDSGLQDGRMAAFAPVKCLEGRYTLDAVLISGEDAARGGQLASGERRGRVLRR